MKDLKLYLSSHIIRSCSQKVSLLRLKFNLRDKIGVSWYDVRRSSLPQVPNTTGIIFTTTSQMITIRWKTDTKNLEPMNKISSRIHILCLPIIPKAYEGKRTPHIKERLTGFTWPSRARILRPVLKSHTRTSASNPHDATNEPSWWKDNP